MSGLVRTTQTGDRLRTGLRLFRQRFGGKPKVAFVLSGGGNLGGVQVGMLRALAEAGVQPDLIVGCSVGAINGAAYAAEPSLAGVERLARIWNRIADGDPDLMPAPRLMPLVAQIARKGAALHDPDVLGMLLDEELPVRTFDQLPIPFACVATDVERADERWFDSGRLVPALLASAALPAVYPPVVLDGRSYIDGGVLREIHAHKAVELGATELYILHVGHLGERSTEIQRPFDAAVQAYWTARSYRLDDDLRRVPDRCVVHRLPAGSKPRLRFDDFSEARELARLSYEASSVYLQTGRTPSPSAGPESFEADPTGSEAAIDEALDTEASPDPVERDVLEALRESVRYPQNPGQLLNHYRSVGFRKGTNDVEH